MRSNDSLARSCSALDFRQRGFRLIELLLVLVFLHDGQHRALRHVIALVDVADVSVGIAHLLDADDVAVGLERQIDLLIRLDVGRVDVGAAGVDGLHLRPCVPARSACPSCALAQPASRPAMAATIASEAAVQRVRRLLSVFIA